eukprot:TRINITY_DN4440_c0_g1_i1.p1 TRINITY_DN4440_c0_g1~~TRINITY_DN4440_c0_g1_i1.p1  ORF type:complete len:159 (+),score=8.08 TRINITY_DN4440_c0_g1_i1:264-740(+)
MDVVDHNPQVIDSIRTNPYYFVPFQYKNTPLETTPYRFISRCTTVPDPQFPHRRILKNSPKSHQVNLFEMDFTKFDYKNDYYDVIISLNSLFYLFKSKGFSGHEYSYLKTLVSSLKIGGKLFIDNKTFDWFQDWKQKGISNIVVTEITFNLFSITRVS